MTKERREAKCLNLSTTIAHELEIASAMERRSQSRIVEELIIKWLDDRRRRFDPAQQRLPEATV